MLTFIGKAMFYMAIALIGLWVVTGLYLGVQTYNYHHAEGHDCNVQWCNNPENWM